MRIINVMNLMKKLLIGSGLQKHQLSKRFTCTSSCGGSNLCPGGAGIYCPDCKIAFIVGGTQGIGYATAMELLKAGVQHVVVAGRNKCNGNSATKALNSFFGHDKCSFIQMDVHDDKVFRAAFESVVRQFNKLDIYINSTGLMDGKNWEKEISTNVASMIRGTLMALEHMGKSSCGGKGGVIVNMAGIMGLDPLPGGASLAATKHAVVGFCKSLGCADLEKKTGLRVLTLCPGFTHTRQTHCLVERSMSDHGHLLEEYFDKAKKQRPDSCGKAVLHLIRHAPTGSTWVIEGARLYLIKLPPKNCYYSLQAQYF